MGASGDGAPAPHMSTQSVGAGTAEAPTPTQTGWLHAHDGAVLYWRMWLPAGVPVAVVIVHHGICEHGERYSDTVRALISAGYIVYAHDARGHGRSSGRRSSFDRFAQLQIDLESFAAKVVQPSHRIPIFLLGYSLGGAVAIAHALRRQDVLAGAVVIGSALGRGAGISRTQTELAATLAAVAPRCPLIRIRPEDMTSDAEVLRSYEADPLIYHGRLDARFVGEMAKAMRRLPTEFHRLRLPLLLIHGADDITASPAGSRALHEGAGSTDKTLVVYRGRRHDVLHEHGHEQVMADVVAWLNARI